MSRSLGSEHTLEWEWDSGHVWIDPFGEPQNKTLLLVIHWAVGGLWELYILQMVVCPSLLILTAKKL